MTRIAHLLIRCEQNQYKAFFVYWVRYNLRELPMTEYPPQRKEVLEFTASSKEEAIKLAEDYKKQTGFDYEFEVDKCG